MAAPRLTIDELPEKVTVAGSEYIVIQDGGVSRKVLTSKMGSQAEALINADLADSTAADTATAIAAAPTGAINGPDVQAQLGQLAAAVAATSSTDLYVDVEDYGVVGDGVADDTAALQAFLNASPKHAHYLRTPSAVYRTTSTLTIPDYPGYRLFGESKLHTTIEADFNNAPILKTSGTYQHSYCFEHFGLRYKVAQAPANTNAVAFLLDGTAIAAQGFNQWHFYYNTLRHLRFAGVHTGIASKKVAGEVQDVWNCTFEDLDFDDISGSLINLRSVVSFGMPINYFKMIRAINNGAPYANSDTALIIDGEYIIDAFDIEDWHGKIVDTIYGQGTIRGLYVERHHAGSSTRMFDFYNGQFVLDQFVIDFATMEGGFWMIWAGGTEGYTRVRIGTGHLTTTNVPPGGQFALTNAADPLVRWDVPQLPTHTGTAAYNGMYFPWETPPSMLTNHGSNTWDPASLANGARTNQVVTVPGAAVGDVVAVGFSQAVPVGVLLTGSVTLANTVAVTMLNMSGATVDLGSGTLRARVWKPF